MNLIEAMGMLPNDLSGSTLKPSRISSCTWRWLDVGPGLSTTPLVIMMSTICSTFNAS